MNLEGFLGYGGPTMFGLSLGHLIVLLVVVLLFGSRRLPDLGHALGKGMFAFKKGLEGKDADGNDQAPKQIDPNSQDPNKLS